MTKKKQKNEWNLPHGLPSTRREFLSTGLIAAAGCALVPRFAFASHSKNLGKALLDSPVPFMVLDLVGGAGLPGNFLVGGAGGSTDLLPSYDLLGWNPRQDAVDNRFGLPGALNKGMLYAGILQTLSVAAQAKLRIGAICHQAQDDSSRNTTSALSEVSRYAIAAGLKYSKGLATINSASGGNTKCPVEDINFKPDPLENTDSFASTRGWGVMRTWLPDTQKQALFFSQSGAISKAQFLGLHADERGRVAGERWNAASTVNIGMGQGGGGDPRQDTNAKAVFGIDNNTSAESADVLSATIAMNLLAGETGPSCIAMGGYDYHDGTSTTGDSKDLAAGRLLGRAFELAHRMAKPLFVQVVTDGGVSARRGGREWTGDSGDKCLTLVMHYNPTAAPAMAKTQVGRYETGQGASRDTRFGANTGRVAQAVFANYLAISGRVADIERIYTASDFSRDDLQEALIFQPTT